MNVTGRIIEESFDYELEGHNGKCKVLYSEMAEYIIRDILNDIKLKICNDKHELNISELQRIETIIDSY